MYRAPRKSGFAANFGKFTTTAAAAVTHFTLLTAMDTSAEARDFEVHTPCYWAETGVRVEKGRQYRVQIVDMSTVQDASIVVKDLNGWPPCWQRVAFAPVFWLRRQAFDPWFSLIATVDKKHPRRLQEGAVYEAPATGQLVCFFNDAPWAYGNNQGCGKFRLVPVPVGR